MAPYPQLIENVDYRLENGLLVFTREYLFKRGSCCASGCRNCPYLKLASFVPSWTETLIECGAQVVARTRFCVHPKEAVAKIPAVGGTKDWDPAKLKARGPRLILLDREENPQSMANAANAAPGAVLATHVKAVQDVERELERIAEPFAAHGEIEVAHRLRELALRWRTVAARSPRVLQEWSDLHGVTEWLVPPGGLKPEKAKFVYVIWKDPWMAVVPGTFIGSVLEKLGIGHERLWTGSRGASLYPRFEMEEVPDDTVLLLSSEPYPFHRKKALMEKIARPVALVDGEAFSWFGVRALKFLEACLSN